MMITASSHAKTYARFVKLEHSVFSLPLIFAGMLLHAHHWPSLKVVSLIVVAAVCGRVLAMGLNRIIDVDIDARNPRTQRRELPRGAMRLGEAWTIVALAGVGYVVSAAAVAPICLWLSPIPVALFVMYPYLKRFTALAHLGLGLAWSMAPVGGWLAVSRSLTGIVEVSWLWFFSVLWVAGFDVIYATMDEAFDRHAGLHSLPVWLGSQRALKVAVLLHLVAFASLCALWYTQLHTGPSLWWLLGIGALFVWQHAISERKPEFAFFKLNGLLGFLVLGTVLVGM